MLRTRKFPPAPAPREEVVQQHIMRALRGDGNLVLSTVNRVKMCKCPNCGHAFRAGGDGGTTPGVPDLLVRPGARASVQWPRAVWLGMEVKGAKTPLSAAQKELNEQGAIVIARSIADADKAVADADDVLALRGADA
jgi:hypothetical protein